MLTGIVCFLFGFFCAPGRENWERTQQQGWPAIVGRASVVDGDTIEIGGRRIRLQAIDAPESGQRCEDADARQWRCGQWAATELERLIGDRTVTCRQDPRDPEDRYERALGLCEVGAGEELNEGMIAAGAAIAYRQYLDYRGGKPRAYKARMMAAEERAAAAKSGIWRGRFVRPDLWRKGER
jgi:endonuclease YncB( thermonuclease family)